MDRITLIFSFCCLLCFISIGLSVWVGWQLARFEQRIDELEEQRIDELETKKIFERW